MKRVFRFKRECLKCKRVFRPTGKYQYICEGCYVPFWLGKKRKHE